MYVKTQALFQPSVDIAGMKYGCSIWQGISEQILCFICRGQEVLRPLLEVVTNINFIKPVLELYSRATQQNSLIQTYSGTGRAGYRRKEKDGARRLCYLSVVSAVKQMRLPGLGTVLVSCFDSGLSCQVVLLHLLMAGKDNLNIELNSHMWVFAGVYKNSCFRIC